MTTKWYHIHRQENCHNERQWADNTFVADEISAVHWSLSMCMKEDGPDEAPKMAIVLCMWHYAF